MEKTKEKWAAASAKDIVEKTMISLKANNIESFYVKNGREAKEKVYQIIPAGAEVLTMSSTTLDTIGLSADIQGRGGRYVSVRNKLLSYNNPVPTKEMKGIGATPDWALGSVHAVTQDGSLFIASNTGSQLPAYAYTAAHVVWVVGTQKIVKDRDEALDRIYNYTLLLENERVKKAYGMPNSAVNKMLVINHENEKNRLFVVFVDEVLGF